MSDYDELVGLLTTLLTQRFAPKPQFIRAILGDGQGNVIVPERPDKSYVRFNRGSTEYFEVFNRTVNPVNDWPVLVGELPWNPGLTQVVDTDWAAFEQSGWGDILGSTSPHAPTHEWPDGSPGSDPLDVYLRSIVPLRVYIGGTGSTTIYVNQLEYEYQGSGHVWAGLPGVDMQPVMTATVTGTMRYMGVYLQPDTNVLGVVTGTTTVHSSAIEPPLVQFPGGVIPAARVRVYGSQTALQEADIRDARRLFDPSITGSVSSGAWPFTVKNQQTGIDYEDLMTAITAATAGDILLVGQDLIEGVTVNKILTIRGMSQSITITGTGISANVIEIDGDVTDCTIENLTIISASTAAVTRGIYDPANNSSYKRKFRRLLIFEETGLSDRIGIYTKGLTTVDDCELLATGSNGIGIQVDGGTTEFRGGKSSGALYDVYCTSGTTKLVHPELVNNSHLAFGGTITGEWQDSNGVTRYIADNTPNNGQSPQWDNALSRWGMGGAVIPRAGKLRIDTTEYDNANDFFDALASGNLGVIGKGTFTTDYSGGHATIPTGTVSVLGQGIDTSILSNTDTGDAYTILVSASCTLQDFTVENDAAAASTAIAISLGVAPLLINIKARGDAAGNAANAVGISGESFEAIGCEFIGEGSTGNNYAVNISVFGTSVVRLTDCTLTGDLNVSGASTVDIFGGLIDGDISTASSPTVTFHNLPTVTGTVSSDCVGAYKDSSGNICQAGGEDIRPDGDQRGLAARFIVPVSYSITDHFRSGSIPTGYTWAATSGVMYGTPTIFSYSWAGEYLYGQAGGAGQRHFLQKAVANSAAAWQNKSIYARLLCPQSSIVGLRLDNGNSDSAQPFVEWIADATAGTGMWVLKMVHQDTVGGGVSTTTTGFTKPITEPIILRVFCYWDTSNYYVFCYVIDEAGVASALTSTAALSWMPVAGRIGLLVKEPGYGFLYDWFLTDF